MLPKITSASFQNYIIIELGILQLVTL